MKKLYSILLAVIMMGFAATAQARPKPPPPLQPVGNQQLMDFTSEVNNPNSPGNDGQNPGINGTSSDNEETQESEAANSDSSSGQDSSGVGIDSFSIFMSVLVVLVSAGIAGTYYWYKTRKTK